MNMQFSHFFLMFVQVENTVERGRFDEMCKELNRALQREQEAQQLLNEQSQQIRELGLRLDLHVSGVQVVILIYIAFNLCLKAHSV